MSAGNLDKARVERLADVATRHVEEGSVVGLAGLVARRGEVHTGVAGTLDVDGSCPGRRWPP